MRIKELTNAEFAILSLIVERPRHGYEIEQVIEERGMRNWTEVGFSSIYYLLKKLEQAGLLSSQLQETEGRGPARKVFHATELGVTASHEATLHALSTPQRFYPPIQIGLSNLPTVPRRDAIDALKRHRTGLNQRLSDIEQSRRAAAHPTEADMMFTYSMALVAAQINWLNGVIEQLESDDYEHD